MQTLIFVGNMLTGKATNNLFLCFCLLAGTCVWLQGCSKKEDIDPEEKVMQYITGMGNRYWYIKEIYVNGTRVTLTSGQQKYTKTYTRKPFTDDHTGTFVDSDGMQGLWKLTDLRTLTEIITNNPGGNTTIVNTINKLSANEIDLGYTGANNDKVRLVYFAY
ncbi:hypothetical protein [Sediminibacterium soli]|uniref:hypothetical protein n=1 Tax=Sediminibacterium soli TaxID=2698829 RepID=UPI00137B6BB8|nr:hypothetical protein [Sediminibacterium soli]NCI46807.1 hypothetical protein [Sediminibacterium soli]